MHGKGHSGILLLDKPQGLSSNRALQKVRHLLGKVKAGHTGTLDPMATGMLPICLGFATRMSHFLLSADKSYHAVAQLGVATDSGDAFGNIIKTCDVAKITTDMLTEATKKYSGAISQIPPMYSALHHNGKRLYELAREGITVDRPSRQVNIHSLALQLNKHELTIEVTCSKGTYIRTLAEDLAAELGTCAHLTQLRRTYTSPFNTHKMISLEDFEAMDLEQRWKAIMPTDAVLEHMGEFVASQEETLHFLQGRPVSPEHQPTMGDVRIYNHEREFIGVGVMETNGLLRPKKIDPAFQSHQ